MHPNRSAYRTEIDGLRALAVLSVVAFHAFPGWLQGGFIGVDVFFVISGFLITTHIFESLDKGQFSFADFFGRRIRRIFPALILVMATSLVFGWFALLPHEYAQLGKHIASGTAFIVNFILVEESGYFDNVAETKPMLHLWSLAVEEQFYIIWPLVLWLAWKRRFSLMIVTISVCLVSFSHNLLFANSTPVETFFFPLGRFWELLTGSVLAWLFLYGDARLGRVWTWIDGAFASRSRLERMKLDERVVANGAAFFGLSLLLYGFVFIHERLAFPSYWALIPVFGAVLVVSAGSRAWLNRVLLMNPMAVWFGLISYPLYLWHWPILSFLQIIEGGVPQLAVRVSAVALSILLAWLTFALVERPIRTQSPRAPKVKHLFLAAVGIGGAAFYVSEADGLKFRPDVSRYSANLDELKRTVAKEEACVSYLGLSSSKFDYCKIGKIGKQGVVAVIGDSHAHVAFPGIATGLEVLGYTSILLANSSCPPFDGSPWGADEAAKRGCAERTEQILANVSEINDLQRVFIFARGPSYWTGTEPSSSRKHVPSLSVAAYFEGLQRTADRLNKQGVDVFYVTENPELRHQVTACLPRPFNVDVVRRCEQELSVVLERQRNYRAKLKQLDGVVVLDSNEAFCRTSDQTCFALNDANELLYADDDHLSVAGSRWQYDKVIKPLF